MTPSYFLGRTFFRLLYGAYFRWRIHNPENVPLRGPAILASNHASFIDPPLIGSPLPREINYLARESLFRFPVIGSIFRSWNAVPVDRDGGGAAGLRVIMDRLQAGGAILLFPEGTRSADGSIQRAHSGVGLIVIKSAAPVIPVRVFGTFEAYNKKMLIPRPRRISVKYGRALDLSTLRAEAKSCSKARLREIYHEATERIMAAISQLQPHTDRCVFP